MTLISTYSITVSPIDAKSILGVLSLDLARVLTVQMNGDNAEFEEYLDTLVPAGAVTAA